MYFVMLAEQLNISDCKYTHVILCNSNKFWSHTKGRVLNEELY